MTTPESLSVLAIDDDPVFLSILKRILRSEFSAEVTTAEDCASARQSLSGSTFDLILLDKQLPDGDGIDLMEEITSVAGHPPVIMVTGKGDEKTAAQACQLGACGYVIKGQSLNAMLFLAIQNSLDRARTARLLRDSEVSYRRLFEAARDGILILDADTGRIVDANPYVEEVLGYFHEEFIGKELWEIGPFKDKEIARSAFAELQEKGYIRYEDLPLETSSGKAVEVEFICNLYASGGKKVIQCNIRDITERKRAEEELERVNSELDGYAHELSHDLRSPLASITMGVGLIPEILGKASLPEEVQSGLAEVLSLLDTTIQGVNNLIASMLTLAEAGQVPDQAEPVDIRDVVKNVLKEEALIIETDGISIEVMGDLGSVYGSPTHFYQLFANLIGNAIAHNDSPSPEITISRLEDDTRGGNRYLVRDNGSGISSENLGKLFIPFFKGKSGSTGIGLSTVRKIIKVYDGEIRAYNDDGACFEFRIRDFCME